MSSACMRALELSVQSGEAVLHVTEELLAVAIHQPGTGKRMPVWLETQATVAAASSRTSELQLRAMKMMKPTRAARTPSHGHIQLATVTDRHGIGVPRTSIASRRGSSGHSRKRDRKQHTHLAPSNSSGVAVKSAFPTLSRRYGQKSTGDVADYSQLDRMACSGVLRLRCVSNNITDLQ